MSAPAWHIAYTVNDRVTRVAHAIVDGRPVCGLAILSALPATSDGARRCDECVRLLTRPPRCIELLKKRAARIARELRGDS